MIILSIEFGVRNSVFLLLNYPQTVLSPGFSLYGFQKNKDGMLALSLGGTRVNCFLIFLGYLSSFLVIWDTVQDYPKSHKDHWLLIELILILFFLSWLLSTLVLHLPCFPKKKVKMSEDLLATCEATSMVQIKGRQRFRSMSV